MKTEVAVDDGTDSLHSAYEREGETANCGRLEAILRSQWRRLPTVARSEEERRKS